MRMNRKWVALAVVGMALAGCGDDGGQPDGSGDDAAELFDAGPDISEAGEAGEGIDGVISYRITSNEHVARDIRYPIVPPPGGPHHDIWVNCGFHDEPFKDENLVHDLEHGAVWLAYSPDLSEADVEVIRDLADRFKVVAAPHEGLAEGEAVVATAWARQLRLDSVDDPRLEQFVVAYEDGSQAPEAGVTCTGTPLG